MSIAEPVLLNIQNGVATLTLNRPNVRNAFDEQMILLLTTHLQHIQQDNAVQLLVLKGAGQDFSAGGDIVWMRRTIEYTPEENYQDALTLAKLMHLLYHFSKPTLVLVQGHVYGGGIGLVACCDIALGQPKTTFCFSEVKLGLVPAVISPYVVKAIGLRATRRYMLTAESFDEKTALSLGLLHQIIPSETVEKELALLIQTLKQNGPNALRQVKTLLHTLSEPKESKESHFSEIEYTARLIADLRVSEEGQEGLLAFLEKRNPNWQK